MDPDWIFPDAINEKIFISVKDTEGSLTVFRDDRGSVTLPDVESRILRLFLEHPGEWFSEEDLRQKIWEDVSVLSIAKPLSFVRKALNGRAHGAFLKRSGEHYRLLSGPEDFIESPEPRTDESSSQIRLTTLEDLRRVPSLSSPADILRILDPLRSDLNFVGRERELNQLCQWLDDMVDSSFQVVVGPSGCGKTRLAVRLLERIEERCKGQWDAGLLPGLLPEDTCEQVLTYDNFVRSRSKDILVILDNASAWNPLLEKQIIPALRARPRDGKKVRFLLIDRGASLTHGWFWNLRTAAEYDRRCRFPKAPLVLNGEDSARQLSFEERHDLLDAALDRLSALTGMPRLTIDDIARERLKEQRMAMPLAVLMAALVASDLGSLLSLTWRSIELAEAIVAHEIRRIKTIAKTASAAEFLLLHMTAYVTLVGGLSATELLRICREEKHTLISDTAVDAAEVAILVSDKVLPSGTTALVAVPIVPDIIADIFVETVFSDPYHSAPETVLRAFKHAPVPVVRNLVHIVQDLTPLAGAPELESRQRRVLDWLDNLLQKHVHSISDTYLWDIQATLPWHSVAMTELTAAFFQRLLEVPNISPHIRGLARLSEARGQTMIGNHSEALIAATQAVEDLESALADDDIDAIHPDLVLAVNAYLASLSNVGEYQKALTVSSEFLSTLRKSSRDHYDFLPRLAWMLLSHTRALMDAGHPLEAEKAIEEAITYYRNDLASTNRDVYLPGWVFALNSRAGVKTALGKLAEALESADESLRYAVELAHNNPDEFQTFLAFALLSKADRLVAFKPVPNSAPEALQMIDQALRIIEELSERRTAGVLPIKAKALFQRARTEATSREHCRMALLSLNRAIELFQELHAGPNRPYLADLASCYLGLRDIYSVLGEVSEALTASESSIACQRELVRQNADRHLPGLADELYWHADLLFQAGRNDGALIAIRETLEFGTSLIKRSPRTFLPKIAKACAKSANIVAQNGNHAEARELLADALRFIKPCAGLFPEEGHRKVATQIAQDYVKACAAVGASADAGLAAPYVTTMNIGAGDERLLREQVGQSPPEVVISMAEDYRNESKKARQPLSTFAAATVQRAETFVQIGPEAPVMIQDERAQLLEWRARQWFEKSPSHAFYAIKEAIPILRLLTQHNRPRFLLRLSAGLDLLARFQQTQNHIPAALASLIEAIEHCSESATADPDNSRFSELLAELMKHQLEILYVGQHGISRVNLRSLNEQCRCLGRLYDVKPERYRSSYVLSKASSAICSALLTRLTARRKHQLLQALDEMGSLFHEMHSSESDTARWFHGLSEVLSGILLVDDRRPNSVEASSCLENMEDSLRFMSAAQQDLHREDRN